MSTIARSSAAVALLMVAGCQEQEPAPPVRPVLSVVVAPQSGRTLGFAGTVEPQFRANLGFRVLGRMIARDVNVGDVVTKGTRLAAIDPLAFELAVRTSQADLSNALAQLANTTATETRQRTLLETNTTTLAQFESAQQAREAADSTVTRARANLSKSIEQLGYTNLLADFDGVVTAIEAEVGQVVAAGKTVVTLARPDIREAVVDVPEDLGGELRPGSAFHVSLQIDTSVQAVGQVREIAPQADSATRTRRVRITLDSPPAAFRLGATITATLTGSNAERIELPASALVERDGKSMVWVVDPASSTVSLREVRISGRDQRVIHLADGVAPGTRVVTAGANSLAPGQTVRTGGKATP